WTRHPRRLPGPRTWNLTPGSDIPSRTLRIVPIPPPRRRAGHCTAILMDRTQRSTNPEPPRRPRSPIPAREPRRPIPIRMSTRNMALPLPPGMGAAVGTTREPDDIDSTPGMGNAVASTAGDDAATGSGSDAGEGTHD